MNIYNHHQNLTKHLFKVNTICLRIFQHRFEFVKQSYHLFIFFFIHWHSYSKTKKGWSKAKLSFANAPENIPSLPYPANTKPLDALVGVLGLLCSMFLYSFSVFMSINYMMPFRFGITSLSGI